MKQDLKAFIKNLDGKDMSMVSVDGLVRFDHDGDDATMWIAQHMMMSDDHVAYSNPLSVRCKV